MKNPEVKKCQALDMNARRCRRAAFMEHKYHGDPEIYTSYDHDPTWVEVWLCEKHKEAVL